MNVKSQGLCADGKCQNRDSMVLGMDMLVNSNKILYCMYIQIHNQKDPQLYIFKILDIHCNKGK
jgi:hypothetical protein